MSTMLSPAISRTRIFELTIEEWVLMFAMALVTVAGIAAISPHVTTWSAIGLGFSAFVVGHLCMTARRFVAFPDLIVSATPYRPQSPCGSVYICPPAGNYRRRGCCLK